MRTIITTIATPAILCCTPLHAAHLWVEGESGKAKNLSHNGWYASVRTGELSGGGWLASYGGSAPVLAEYPIDLPAAGTYTLWVRANPVAATLHVDVGDGRWTVVPISEKGREAINIASDGKPDMRFVAWVSAGRFKFGAGRSTLRFRMSSKNGNHGAIDCFCLTTDSTWEPSKAIKPGEDAPFWPAPKLEDGNLVEWGDFIRPSDSELGWRKVRWHRHLDEAAEEARRLGRPILLWAMNGHPCGET